MHIWHSHASDGCIPTATSESAATMTQRCQQPWLYINSEYQPQTARQPQPGHSRLNHITCIPTASEVTASLAQCASDVCIPTATSEAAAAMTHPPVSAIAIYQQRPATINSDQCSNSNYDSRVSNSCISTATSRTAAANLTSVSAIAIITVYQQRSAK